MHILPNHKGGDNNKYLGHVLDYYLRNFLEIHSTTCVVYIQVRLNHWLKLLPNEVSSNKTYKMRKTKTLL